MAVRKIVSRSITDGAVAAGDIANSSISYAKIQNVAAGKVLGRDTSGSGVAQELPIAVDTSGNLYLGTSTAVDQITGTNFNINGPTGQASKIIFSVNNVSTGFIYNNASEVAIGYPSAGSFKLQLSGTGNVLVVDSAGRLTTPLQPSFSAGSNSGDTSVSSYAAVPFDTTSGGGFNVGNCYNTSTYRFTAPIAGKYEFTCSAYYTSSGGSTQSMQLAPYVNGSQVLTGGDAILFSACTPNSLGATVVIAGTVTLNLSANDYVQVVSRGTIARLYMGHTKFMGRLVA